MTQILRRRLVLLASLALVAAVPAVAQTPAAEPAAKAEKTEKGPASAIDLPPPPEGKGQVVFFRPGAYVGMAVSFSIHEGDKGVGKLGNGSYFVLTPDPGAHEYTIQFEAKDALHMEVEAGETYYVQQTIGMGVLAARPHLTPSDKGAFQQLKHMKLSTKLPTDLKPKGEAPAKDEKAEKADKADK